MTVVAETDGENLQLTVDSTQRYTITRKRFADRARRASDPAVTVSESENDAVEALRFRVEFRFKMINFHCESSNVT